MLQNLPYRAKTAYAAVAHGTGRVLTSVHIMSKDVPDRSHRWRHWAHSLTVVHDSAAIAELDVPWWTYSAIDAVDSWLTARPRPIRVFEYGSGASTLWLSRRVDEIHSVEHHAGFAATMAPAVRRARQHRLPGPRARGHRRTRRCRRTSPAMPARTSPTTSGPSTRSAGTSTSIVIDGRAREACLVASLPHVAHGRADRLRQHPPQALPGGDRGLRVFRSRCSAGSPRPCRTRTAPRCCASSPLSR